MPTSKLRTCRPRAPAKQRLESALQQVIDWRYVLRQVMRQGIEPLVHEHLSASASWVSRDVLHFVAARAGQVTVQNLQQMYELNRWLTHMERNGIPVIPLSPYARGARLIAYAKHHLRSGNILDGIDGYACYGQTEKCEDDTIDGLQIRLAHGVRVNREIRPDEPNCDRGCRDRCLAH